MESKKNNLPIPNAREWELKGQRKHSRSLITLKHIEPSPRAAGIVAHVLLPGYGWRHKDAGHKYPESELSFRSTTSADRWTNRGFRLVVDRQAASLRLRFDPAQANADDPEIAAWLASVKTRVGLGPIEPEPYWGLEDLRYQIGSKIRNCFYVVADSVVQDRHELFKYERLLVLSGFSFDRFIACIERGHVLVDFYARTGHNHGTKFRLHQMHWADIFSEVTQVI